MFKCARCNNESSDVATCSRCKCKFDFACAGITEAGYRKLGDRKNNWRCPECKTRSSSPLVPKVVQEPTSSEPVDVQSQLQDIMERLAPLKTLSEDVRAIKDDLAALQKSLDFAHNSIKEYAETMKSFEVRVKAVEESTVVIPSLQADVVRLEQQLHERDQWDRANNIEIKGIPLKKNENLYDVVMDIGNYIGCSIKKEEINYLARIPSQQSGVPKPIIVAFNNRYKKEDVVALARIRKELYLKDLKSAYANEGRFFINDHLTVRNKKLLTKAKSLAKEKNFQFIWVKHSKIMARRNPTSPIFVIKTEADLLKIT